jgi:long-chain acyl-CoA synthetase
MLFGRLREAAASAPRSGLRHRGRFYPYPELADRAERLAAGLLDRGIGPGARVAFLVPNSPDLFLAFFALWAVGGIAVPLNIAATAAELASAADKCGLDAIIVRDENLPAAERLAADLQQTLPIIRTSAYDVIMRSPQRLPAVPSEATALYLFSSGSTGRPKVVPHTHGTLMTEGKAAGADVGLTSDDVVLNSLPGHHGFGFMTVHLEAVARGATTAYWSDPAPFMLARSRYLAAIAAERATVVPGVPYAFDALIGLSDEPDLSSVRKVYIGGVSLRRPLYERFHQRFGKRMGQIYGSTEFGQIAHNDGSDPETVEAVGRVTPGTSVELVDGEILVRSTQLTPGYLNADPASNAVFADGGFRSGDLGRIDEHGNLYVTGRSKLILEVAGMKVDPIEVEDVFLTHPAVAEAVVVGVPDPRSGEQRLKLVAVLRESAGHEALIRYGRERLTAYKAPAIVEFIDAMPRSATGKILRGKLIEGG